MKKKRRVPEPKQSAFESARAALERAGEEEEPSVSADAPETVESAETAAPVADTTDSAEASAPVDATPDNAEASASVTDTTDSAEASAPATDMPDNAETPVSVDATPDSAEASAPVADTIDSAEMSAPVAAMPEVMETLETSAAADHAETPVPAFATADGAEASAISETPDAESADDAPDAESDPDASAPVTADGAESADAAQDAPDALPDSSEDEADEGGEWEMEDAEEETESENVETERRTMETKEITVGYHRSSAQDAGREAEAVKTPKERETKSRFKALDQFKDAFRAHTDQRDYEDENPPSGSSRDAALRKRVMQIEDDETRNYLLDRVLPQMTWYSKRSSQYRSMYYRLMAATIFLGALIPVFSVGGSYGVVKVIIALLGASVTAINAYIALHNYHDLWITYQKTREDLIHTLYCYFNNAGVFSQKKMPQQDLNVLLVDICEDTLSKENGGWTTIVQKT